MVDKVTPAKFESTATGGDDADATEFGAAPASKNEDALQARGYYIQNDTSNDTNVMVSRDSSDNMTFKDGVVSGTKTLTDLLGGGGAVSSVFTRTGAVVAASGDYNAGQVTFTANGNIAATTVQAAVQEVRDESVQDGDTAGGQLGGTYPNPDVRGIRETSGPTNLTIGTITDGELLKRSGSTLISVPSSSFSFSMRNVLLFEHFVNYAASSQIIGNANWLFSNTGGHGYTGEADHPGISNITTPGINSFTSIYLADTYRQIVTTSSNTNPIVFDCLIRVAGSTSLGVLKYIQVGLGYNTWSSNPGTLLSDAIVLRIDRSTSLNWQGVCTSSSTSTTTDLGTAISSGTWIRLGFIYTPSGTPSVQFYINGSAAGSAITTNIPSTSIGPGFRIDTGTTSGTAPELNIDYVLITQTMP